MSYIFVKSSYTDKIDGTMIDGTELVFGKTAFASLDEVAKADDVEDGATIVVLDSKALSDGVELKNNDIITAYDKVASDGKINLTAKGSLTVDGGELGNIGKLDAEGTIGFQNVTVQDGATVGNLLGGKTSTEYSEKRDWEKETYTEIDNSNKTAAGKLVVEESEIGEAYGYATVELNAATTKGIFSGSVKENRKEDEKGDVITHTDSTDKKASGKLTAVESEVNGNINRYANVDIKNSNVGDVIGGSSATSSQSKEGKGTYSKKDTEKSAAAGKATFVEANAGSVEGYANVDVKDSEIDALIGGSKDSSTENKSDDKKETGSTKVAKKAAAAGKAVIAGADSVIGAVAGYATVEVSDGADVGDVTAENWSVSSDSAADGKKETEKSNFKYAVKSTGKLSVEDAFVDAVAGFSTVDLDNAEAGAIHAFAGSADADLAALKPFTEVTISSNKTAETSVEKITQKIASVGKLTAADSKFAGAAGFATVDVKDSDEVTGDITKADTTIVTETTVDADDVETVKTTTTNKLGGTAKFAAVKGGANVAGYAKVTVEDSELGNITNGTVSKTATTTVDGVLVAGEFKAAANGSIDIKISKVGDVSGFKAVTVVGKKSKEDEADETVVNSISTGVNDNIVDAKMTNSIKVVDGDEYIAYNGKFDFAETQKADGTVKVTDATVTEAITGYKDVTLTNAVAGAISAGDNEVEKASYTVKTVEKKEKDKDGNVDIWGETTINGTYSEVESKGGKFTATNSTFGDVDGYSEVKLTDIKTVDAVTGTLETKENSKFTLVGNADDVALNLDLENLDLENIADFDNAETSGSNNGSNSEKSVGSFNYAVKDLAKGDELVTATVGAITDFNKVTVAGVAAEYKRNEDGDYEVTDKGLEVTTGAISDSGSYSATYTSKYIKDDGKAQGREFTATNNQSYAATGSVAISDNVVVNGNIKGFKTVSITGNASLIDGANDTEVNGSIFAYDTDFAADDYFGDDFADAVYSRSVSNTYKEKFAVDKDGEREEITSISGKSSETESGKAAGSITVDAADVTGFINGFDKATVTDANVTGWIDRGTDWTDKSDSTISTKGEQVTITSKYSSTETAAGSVKVVDSTVGGAIADYAKVELVDSNAGAIVISNKVVINASTTFIYDDIKDYYADPEMAADEYNITYKKVETAIGDVKVSISADKAKEMFEDDLAPFVEVGAIAGAKSVTLSGIAHDLDKDQVAFVVTGGIDGGNTETTYNADEEESKEVITETAAGSVDAKYAQINGNISDFDKVTLTNSFVDGNIIGGNKVTTDIDAGDEITEDMTASGSLKAVDTDIDGDIFGFAKVELDDVSDIGKINGSSSVVVDGEIEEIGSEATLKMVDSDAAGVVYFKSATVENSEIGVVAEVESFTAAKGIVEVDTFFGGEEIDTTLTINKGAVMTVGSFYKDEYGFAEFYEGYEFAELGKELDFVEFGDKGDKLAINGTLVVGDDAVYEKALKLATGSGEIAANRAIYDAIKEELDDFDGSFINLGTTATGFRGAEYEKADNEAKGAVEIDLEDGYTGWLGAKVDGDDKKEQINFFDTVDYIKFTVEEGDTDLIGKDLGLLDIEGVEISLKLNGEDSDKSILGNLAAGDYLVKLERKDENSVSYTIPTLA